MKKLGLLLVLWCGIIHAQNPFAEYDYEPQIGTLSKGKFIEDFDNDTIVRIGSVMLNVKNNTITSFVEESVTFTEAGADPTVMSRWFQPDPLAEEFYEWSPYNFVYNNPIRYIDPDGRMPIDPTVLLNVGLAVTSINLEEVVVTASSSEVTDFGGKNAATAIADLEGFDKLYAEAQENLPELFGRRKSDDGRFFVDPAGRSTGIVPIGAPVNLPFGPGGAKNVVSGVSNLSKAVKSSKGLLKAAKLPTRGRIRFVPRASDIKNGKLLKKNGGYVDKFGNVWKKPSGNIVGEMHWDVQLSAKGKQQLGWLSNSGNHVNVSIDGRVVH